MNQRLKKLSIIKCYECFFWLRDAEGEHAVRIAQAMEAGAGPWSSPMAEIRKHLNNLKQKHPFNSQNPVNLDIFYHVHLFDAFSGEFVVVLNN